MGPLDLAGAATIVGHGVGLRAETEGDRDFTRALYATHRAAELAIMPWDHTQKSAFIDHQVAAQRAHLRAHRPVADYLIMTRGPDPIGRVYVDRAVDPWRLAEITLLPDEAGRGLGAALVRWLLGEARAAGACGIDLHVTIDNPRAAGFYRRLGFEAATSDFESHHRMLHTLDRVS